MSLDNTMEILRFLMQKPRTVRELVEATGFSADSIRRTLHAAQRNGLVYVAEHRRTGHMPAEVWAWETTPFEHAL